MATRCPSCKLPGTSQCGGCKSVAYCSKECQEADWHAHRFICKSFKTVEARADARLAIFFPHDRWQPELVWIHGSDKVKAEEDLKRLIGVDELGRREILYNPILSADRDEAGDWLGESSNRTVTKHVTFVYDNAYVFKYQQDRDSVSFNQSIIQSCASGTKNRLQWGWSGPAVAYANGNMDPTAFSDLVAWFIWHYNGSPAQKLREGDKVQVVKANCKGARQVPGIPHYGSLQLPRMHPMFEDHTGRVSAISEAIGMPIMTWKCPLTKAQEKDWSCKKYSRAVTMHRGIDPNDDQTADPMFGFGSPPTAWGNAPGNVLLARVDREPLEPDIAAAFADYCANHLGQFFQYAKEAEANARADKPGEMGAFQQMVLDQMTPEVWDAYLGQWRKVKEHKTKIMGGESTEGDGVTPDTIDGIERMGLTKRDGEKLSCRLFGFGEVYPGYFEALSDELGLNDL